MKLKRKVNSFLKFLKKYKKYFTGAAGAAASIIAIVLGYLAIAKPDIRHNQRWNDEYRTRVEQCDQKVDQNGDLIYRCKVTRFYKNHSYICEGTIESVDVYPISIYPLPEITANIVNKRPIGPRKESSVTIQFVSRIKQADILLQEPISIGYQLHDNEGNVITEIDGVTTHTNVFWMQPRTKHRRVPIP